MKQNNIWFGYFILGDNEYLQPLYQWQWFLFKRNVIKLLSDTILQMPSILCQWKPI